MQERVAVILVVDDEPMTLQMLSFALEKRGYLVATAGNGMEALDKVKEVKPDLILLDLYMPQMNGVTVCKLLKEDPETSDIAVIALTAHASDEVMMQCLEAGANEFLAKPVDHAELFLRVKNLLQIKQFEVICRQNELLEQNSLALESKNRLLANALEQRKQACRDLKASQEQLLHQEKLATIGHLAAGVAHEINNPTGYIGSNLGTLTKYMGRITEFIQLLDGYCAALPAEKSAELAQTRKNLKIDFLMEDSRDILGECLDGVERIKKIVEGLKTFSRKDQNISSLANINDCLENALTVAWNELKYKATVEKDYGDIPAIRCYPSQLAQVFMNLLVNAAHAIANQGIIRIRTFTENNLIFVSITDTGCGISPENQKKIFAPFFTTKEEGVGTGLGLSIVSEIVARHGGKISVQSEVGRGTTFTVSLPIAEETA